MSSLVIRMVYLLMCFIQIAAGFGLNDIMIGDGMWITKKLTKCPDDKKYNANFLITRKKVNRTHDGFNLHGMMDFALDDSLGIFIEACKYMDGGCKRFQTFSDDCACCFLKRYAEKNMRELLTMGGLEPPECPVPRGEVNVTDYVFNYAALPSKGIYGTYDAKVYIRNPKVDNEPPENIACLLVTLQFEKDVGDD